MEKGPQKKKTLNPKPFVFGDAWGRRLPLIGGGGLARFFSFKGGGGALLEEASAFKKYFGPGPRPARVAINLRGFINQELTLVKAVGPELNLCHQLPKIWGFWARTQELVVLKMLPPQTTVLLI